MHFKPQLLTPSKVELIKKPTVARAVRRIQKPLLPCQPKIGQARETGLVQRLKVPLRMSTFHIKAPAVEYQLLVLFQPPANVHSGRQQGDNGSSTVTLSPTWKTQKNFPAPGFVLAQFQLLWAFESESAHGCSLYPYLSLSVSFKEVLKMNDHQQVSQFRLLYHRLV